MQNGIRVAVLDDHPPFVHRLEALLTEVSGGRTTVVATAAETAKVTSAVRDAVPDLVFAGLDLPPPGSRDLISLVRQAAPQARILAVTDDAEPAGVLRALRAGAAGVLHRSTDAALLRHPLLAALDGWGIVPPGLLTALVEQGRGQAGHAAATALDDADRRLLRLIAGGSSTSEIAGLLHVSERTVKRLTATLLRKLRVSSRTEAAALAGSAGLV